MLSKNDISTSKLNTPYCSWKYNILDKFYQFELQTYYAIISKLTNLYSEYRQGESNFDYNHPTEYIIQNS